MKLTGQCFATKGLRVGTKDIDSAMQTEQSRIKNGTQCYIFAWAGEQNNALWLF